MQPKQVFFTEKWQAGIEKPTAFIYCPTCKTPLISKENGGKSRPTCPSCGFTYFQNPSTGVVVLIEDEGRVLLGKRTSASFGAGKWCLPQGYIEFDDDFLTAAIREVKEETHLDVEIRTILSVVSNFLAPGLHTLVVVVLARVVAGEPHAGDDLDEVAWFPLTGPLPEIAFDADQHIIERYHQTRLDGAPVDPLFASPKST